MRQNSILENVTSAQLRTDIPEFRAGDTVKVYAKIVEGSRERIQLLKVL